MIRPKEIKIHTKENIRSICCGSVAAADCVHMILHKKVLTQTCVGKLTFIPTAIPLLITTQDVAQAISRVRRLWISEHRCSASARFATVTCAWSASMTMLLLENRTLRVLRIFGLQGIALERRRVSNLLLL